MSDDQISIALNTNIKEAGKIAQRLKTDRWIDSHSVTHRKKQHVYYFINWKQVIYLIKYKIHMISKLLEQAGATQTSSFKCPACQMSFSLLDISKLEMTEDGFLCSVCQILVQDTTNAPAKETDKYSTFMNQIKPIIELLKRADEVEIPEIKVSDIEKMHQQEEPAPTAIEEPALPVATTKSEIVVEILGKRPAESSEDEDEFVSVGDDSVVQVNGEYIPLSHVTQDHKIQMTAEEFENYSNLLKN